MHKISEAVYWALAAGIVRRQVIREQIDCLFVVIFTLILSVPINPLNTIIFFHNTHFP